MQVISLQTIFVPSQILFKKPDINLGDNSSGWVTKKKNKVTKVTSKNLQT